MSATSSPHDTSLRSSESGQRSGMISNSASRAGRELVWLTVAAAFLIVEAFVFVTDLPVSKVFSRRDVAKSSRAH